MPRWLPRELARIHQLAAEGRIRFTAKARQELAALHLDSVDVVELLQSLRPDDSRGRLLSVDTGEWMYVFRPRIGETTIYVKLLLRTDCVVVSFHEQAGDEGQGED